MLFRLCSESAHIRVQKNYNLSRVKEGYDRDQRGKLPLFDPSLVRVWSLVGPCLTKSNPKRIMYKSRPGRIANTTGRSGE